MDGTPPMIRFLFDCLLWGLGFERRDQATSTGFDGEHLIPTRQRSGLEAAIRALSSLIFVLAFAVNVAGFILATGASPEVSGLLAEGTFPALAWASAAWCLLMLCRPSLPMDSTAIGTGLWSFAGYLPYFLIGNLFAVPVSILFLQAGLAGGVISYGLFRDIRREMKADQGDK
jgi:hypothetical protein